MTTNNITLSVVIKALNEEDHIAGAIESALRAISEVGGEVILADSHSTDKTVEIASRYPIKIVRLNRAQDRCCGVGGQLGYQFSTGKYVCIVDGDMELVDGFIVNAICDLEKNPSIAGVGGRIVEKNLESLEFQARLLRAPENLQPGIVDRLNGGGVYRRSAIESIGYFTNKNLHSYEEYELGIRLRSAGWILKRLPTNAILHFGHKTEAFALLFRRWRSGYALGLGELLRSSLGKPYFAVILREIQVFRLYTAVITWWVALFLLVAFELFVGYGGEFAVFLALLPIAVMTIKKRSLVMGIYSLVSWNVYALGMLRGLFNRQRFPSDPIDAETVMYDGHRMTKQEND